MEKRLPKKLLFAILILLCSAALFAAVPIQDHALTGAASANARLRLLYAAESCLGVPYRYAGLDRRGLDCSGLVFLSFREALNISVPRTASNLYSWTARIQRSELAPGDLVFFITDGRTVSHVGIYAGDGWFIHSASSGTHTGVIYSRLDESYWRRTYTAAGRALPWDSEAATAMAALLSGGSVAAAGASGGTAVAAQSGSGTVAGQEQPVAASAPASSSANAPNVAVSAAGASASAVGASAPTESAIFTPGIQPEPVWGETGFFAGFGTAWNWGGFFDGSPSIFRGITIMSTFGYRWPKYRAGLELRPVWDLALGVTRFPFILSFGNDFFQVFAGPAFTFGDPELDLDDYKRQYRGGGTWLWELGVSGSLPLIKKSPGVFLLFGELAWQPYLHAEGDDFMAKPDFTANLRLSTGLRYLWLVNN